MLDLATRRGLLVATALVVATHLAFLALYPAPPITSDALAYERLAESLARGTGYVVDGRRETNYMPGYPVFVAGIYALGGVHPAAVRLVQTLLVGLLPALLYQVARRFLDEAGSARVFWGLGLLPALFAYQADLRAEALSVALVVLFLAMLLEPWRGGEVGAPVWEGAALGWAARLGLSLGLLVVTRAEYFLWAPALLVVPWLRGLRGRRLASVVAVAGLCAAAPLGPWVARNAMSFGQFIPLSTITGRTLWLAAHEPELTEYGHPEFQQAAARCLVATDPRGSDACFRLEAVAMARAHPRYFALHAVGRLVRTLAGSQTDVLVGLGTPFSQALRERRAGTLAVKGTLLALHTGLAVLGLAGLWRRRHAPLWALLGFLVGSKLAVHALVFGTPRYAVPLYPLLLLGASALFSPPASSRPAVDAPVPARVLA